MGLCGLVWEDNEILCQPKEKDLFVFDPELIGDNRNAGNAGYRQ